MSQIAEDSDEACKTQCQRLRRDTWSVNYVFRGYPADMVYKLAQYRLIGSLSVAYCLLTQSPVAFAAGSDQTSAPTFETSVPAPEAQQSLSTRSQSLERSSLEMISPQAQAHIDYALTLAERGAVKSAQAEFVAALVLIADALDADTRNPKRAHARAVQVGMTAIEETADFVPSDTPHNVVINLAQLATTHHTPVLKNLDAAHMTRAEALQRYHSYATQQLAFAGGRSAIASSALYGLGRAESAMMAGASSRNPLGAPNAMALYQAALLVDPQNYMAANELGVLMARFGDLQSAADQFEYSLSIKPRGETWHNLAATFERMGQTSKAELAKYEREKLLAVPRTDAPAKNPTDLAARTSLRWIDTDTFAATATPYGLDGMPVNANKSAPIAQRDSLGKRWIAKLNPWPKAEKPDQDTHTSQPGQENSSHLVPAKRMDE
jgi:tetratricopeptide (TPR) repeat protein